jgi:acetoin utilization deacetylase AcuC-like enzyme
MRVIYSSNHSLHATADLTVEGHPFVIEEVPQRAEVIRRALEANGFGPCEAPKDHGCEPILAVHDPDYVDYLKHAFEVYVARYPGEQAVVPGTFALGARRKTRHIYGQAGYYAFGIGAPILQGTWQAAYWSAQCALTAADAVRQGEPAAYALCRPPGHHTTANQCGGFCYLNNAAIAARHLQAGQPGSRIAILDVDYHHGNGTQEIFYSDPSVLFCSLHADPDEDYPYFWGGAEERGEGSGAGFNRNWPLPLGITDPMYLAALCEAVEAIRAFAPRFLVVSLGLDTFTGDPVGGFALTTEGLAEAGQQIAGLGLPTVVVQEGGYLLEKLGTNAAAFLGAFNDS